MVRDFFITGMKRLFRSILFCTAIMYCGVLTSTAGVKDDKGSPGLIRPESAQDDHPVRIAFFDLDIIAPSSGVQFFRDGIVFLGLSKNYSKMVPEHVSFGTVQAYYAVPGDTSLQNPIIFSPDFRFSWPCDAISFNASYDKMYFTRKDKAEKHEKIYVSDYTGGRNGKGSWSDVSKPLDFCTGDFIYTHPALSGDGNMMIFAPTGMGLQAGSIFSLPEKTEINGPLRKIWESLSIQNQMNFILFWIIQIISIFLPTDIPVTGVMIFSSASSTARDGKNLSI